MFGFGTPACPLEDEERIAMEEAMTWFVETFGMDRIRQQPIITPTNDWFPFALDGTFETAEKMFDLVCEYMNVEKGEATFELFDPDRMKFPAGMPYEWSDEGAAGYYTDEVYRKVAVSEEALGDPEDFIGTVAHELGHVILLGRGHLDPEKDPDHEIMTDMLTVVFGMGIFGANAALREKQWSGLGTEGWSWSRTGYFTFQEWGYSHSLLAYARQESKPDWARHLRPDIRAYFKDGLKYLQRGGETEFKL